MLKHAVWAGLLFACVHRTRWPVLCSWHPTPVFVTRIGSLFPPAGPNGCGKSTLVKALCGLHRLSSGRMNLRGACLSGPAGLSGAMFVPQRPLAAPGSALWQQLCYPGADGGSAASSSSSDLTSSSSTTSKGELGPQRQPVRPPDAHLLSLLRRVGLEYLLERVGGRWVTPVTLCLCAPGCRNVPVSVELPPCNSRAPHLRWHLDPCAKFPPVNCRLPPHQFLLNAALRLPLTGRACCRLGSCNAWRSLACCTGVYNGVHAVGRRLQRAAGPMQPNKAARQHMPATTMPTLLPAPVLAVSQAVACPWSRTSQPHLTCPLPPVEWN